MDEIKKKKSCGWLGCLIVLVIVILVPLLLFGSCKLMYSLNTNAVGKRAVQLLDKKYNDKFAIKWGRYDWSTSAYQFIAYPINEPTFKFMVFINSMTSSGISTTYLLDRRIDDLMKQAKPYVDALTPKNIFYSNSGTAVTRISSIEKSKEILDYIGKTKITSNNLLLQKYPYLLDTHTGITYCYDVTDSSREKIAKSVYNLLCFYRNKKFGLIDIGAAFYNADFFDNKDFKREARAWPGWSAYGSKFDPRTRENIYKYKAKYNLGIVEKYDFAKNVYIPSSLGGEPSSDTNRIITNYKDVERQINDIEKYKLSRRNEQ